MLNQSERQPRLLYVSEIAHHNRSLLQPFKQDGWYIKLIESSSEFSSVIGLAEISTNYSPDLVLIGQIQKLGWGPLVEILAKSNIGGLCVAPFLSDPDENRHVIGIIRPYARIGKLRLVTSLGDNPQQELAAKYASLKQELWPQTGPRIEAPRI